MEIDERLIKKLIEGLVSSSMSSAEKGFNEIYDGFKEEYLNLKYHSENMELEEKKERILYLSEKIDNMLSGFVGTSKAQENRFNITLHKLSREVTHLYEEVRDKIIKDKQLPF